MYIRKAVGILTKPWTYQQKGSTSLSSLTSKTILTTIVVDLYRWQPDTTSVAQILELQPTRAGGSDVFYLEQGSDVVLRFFMMTHFKGTATVTIARIEGDTLMMVTDYSHFDGAEQALLWSLFSSSHPDTTPCPLLLRPGPNRHSVCICFE
jgi:hypothetical protein